MRRKPSPLAPKMKLTPANGIKSAANRGPTIPERSICNPARVYAEPNSSAETTSAMTEEWAGELKAKPPLKRNALARIRQGLGRCDRHRTARAIAMEECQS